MNIKSYFVNQYYHNLDLMFKLMIFTSNSNKKTKLQSYLGKMMETIKKEKKVKVIVALMFLVSPVFAQQRFSDLVGPVGVNSVQPGTINVPYITWGGDASTFQANGGIGQTVKGSIYDKMGLNLKLTNGDDFVQQVRDYMTGKTPFLRGTFDMLGMASEVLNSDPRTKPVILFQMTWSAGDHIVARQNIQNLNDFVRADGKKIKIAVQQGGPHVGLIYKALQAAQAKIDRVEIVWCQDLMGEKGPAEAFRKDNTIDACCVVTPDMIGLTGGLESKGTNAEGNVLGSHVVVSTQQMSRAIPDVYAVRSDWYQNNKETAEKFVAGYLRACEDVVLLRKSFDGKKLSKEYAVLLTYMQNAFGKTFIPTLEVDAHGLLLDTVFVGLTGQVAFFEDKGNLNGYETCAKGAVDLSVDWGYSKNRNGFVPPGIDYVKLASLAGIKYEAVVKSNRINAESVDLFPDSNLDDRTILTFNINFEPNQNEFSDDQYGAEFERAVKAASTFGNAVIAIRGHSDPTKTLVDLVQAGMTKGLIKRDGKAGSFKYYFDGKELNLGQTDKIVALIKAGAFDGVNPSPRETMQAALNLSLTRAEAVKSAMQRYASKQKINLDATQIQPVGAGILEPLVAKPKNIDEAKKNMRVVFVVLKVNPEALNVKDFDY